MATADLTFYKYRYSIEALDVIFPKDKEPIKVPIKQQKIFIERDFENDMFPIIRLDALFDTSLHYRIIAEKNDVRFRIKLRKYRMRQEEVVKTTDTMNATFGIFIDENTPQLDKNLMAASENIAGKQPSQAASSAMSLYLYKEKDLTQTKKIINHVFTSSNMTNVIAYLMASSGFNKVLMTPLDNKASFKEIIIPPLTLKGALKYLESQYGFYTSGSTIFFDIDLVYIIKKSAKLTAWSPGEFTKVVLNVSKSASDKAVMSGMHHDEKKKSYIIQVQPKAITFASPSVLQDQFDGNHRLIINPSIDKTYNIKSKTVQRGDGTYKVVVNPYGNTFMNTAEQYALTSNSSVIMVEVKDIDTSVFSPNKEFAFQFDDKHIHKAHGGTYRLAKTIEIYSGTGSALSVTSRAYFTK